MRGAGAVPAATTSERDHIIAIRRSRDDEHRRNDEIRAREVRLIDASGNQVGVVPLPEALAAASKAGKDLVEVAPNADPTVCRIMDYGKFRYEQAAKDKAARQKQRGRGVKEMKYRPNIGDGDLDTKNRKVAEFIEDGHKVKLTVRLRGRERSKPEMGRDVIDRILEEFGDDVVVDHPARAEGRTVSAVIAPAPTDN